MTAILDSLAGLSVGDALGAQYFVPGNDTDALPDPPWPWTDDTEMACSVVTELLEHGTIDHDRLARAFAERYEPYRGYGGGAVVILRGIRDGVPWREAAGAAFDGQGSCGNGAAMRVAPLGAFFADDPDRVVEEAVRSAEVTHLHPEGVHGAVAVALAAAHLGDGPLLDFVLQRLPDSEVRRGVVRARELLGRSAGEAAHVLGNGSRETAQLTVPFTLWVAASHLADYPAAITTCVRAGGDVDTTSAIVGGIVAAHTGLGGIPAEWIAAREPLPDWTATRRPS